jgi:hypothetical protein
MRRLLIFAFFGPVIGLLAFASALAIFGLISQPSGSLTDAVGVFAISLITGLPIAILVGSIPALMAGALFIAMSSLIARRFQPSNWNYSALGAAIGLAVSAGLSVPTQSKDLMGLLILPGTVAGALLGWHLRPKVATPLLAQVWAATEPMDAQVKSSRATL